MLYHFWYIKGFIEIQMYTTEVTRGQCESEHCLVGTIKYIRTGKTTRQVLGFIMTCKHMAA